ncbi:MAG: hypothetical protein L7S56_04925 [Candidatus Poseidonia sp.]|nr:hypothetical protein [Poseidonia sp.]
MRHLRVPSAETQSWLMRCRSSGWLWQGSGVVELDDHHRGIPLTEQAPPDEDDVWEGHGFVEIDAAAKSPSHWTQRLPKELQALPSTTWPSAYELQGDLLIVKLEPGAELHQKAMAEAMLGQLSNVRVICADEGVHGDFRVRDLRVIMSRESNDSTRTRVREHGHQIWVDPGAAYFSSRLSTERHKTLLALQELRDEVGHALIVADPYAGVGPAFPLLLESPGLLKGYLAGDLNPSAVELLKINLEDWTSRDDSDRYSPSKVMCEDARAWQNDTELRGQADALLVNLPHESFEHLDDLLPLLKTNSPVMLRGWAIRERGELEADRQQLERWLIGHKITAKLVHIKEIKGYSSTRCFAVFECRFTR